MKAFNMLHFNFFSWRLLNFQNMGLCPSPTNHRFTPLTLFFPWQWAILDDVITSSPGHHAQGVGPFSPEDGGPSCGKEVVLWGTASD